MSDSRRLGGVLQERFVDINGRRMRYLIGGTGKPLVLCHGFISSGEEFGGRFVALAQQRTLIAPDLPGNGESAPLGGRHSVAAMAEAVDGLLDHLNVGEFDLGGLCLGASVACALGERRGDDVGQLILHTPLISPTIVRRRFRQQIRILTRSPLWEMVIWLSHRRLVSDLYRRWVVRETRGDARIAEINYRNQLRADTDAARQWLVDALKRDDLEWLRHRDRPVLVIAAAHDSIVDIGALRAVATTLPGATVRIDAEHAHGWSADAVERHLELLRAYLEPVPPTDLSYPPPPWC